jgi:pimeloyl-ACP methyl ester carboxylesterase
MLGYLLASIKDLLLLPLAGYYLWNPLKWKVEEKETFDHIKPTVIVLIHGSGFNQSEWIVARRHLANHEELKHHKVISFDWDDGNPETSIEEYAARIAHHLPKDHNVILIGHSMGGLMAAYFAEFYGQDMANHHGIDIIGVVTIATPWKGSTSLLPFANFKNYFGLCPMAKRYRQMLPHSEFLMSLYKQMEQNQHHTNPQYLTVGSHHDFLVPFPQCHPPDFGQGKHKKFNLSNVGHYSIITSSQLWNEVTINN